MKKIITYIIITIIVITILIFGFIYGNNTTEKYEEVKPEIKEIKEDKKEEIIKYKVDIKGSVKKPGVYELIEGSRIIDVIKASGGLNKDSNTDYINLSKKIKDEMVIIIYSNKEIKELKEDKKEIIKYEIVEVEKKCPNKTNDACIENKTETTKTLENEDSNGLIDINTASKEQLMTLPSIGESKANLIIDYRSENRFNSIEDIKNVSGIGNSLYEKIKDFITV